MAEEVTEIKRLREVLDQFRSQPRASFLLKAMEDLKKALPEAFDATNEKKKVVEEGAYKLYHECEEALRASHVQTPPTERDRDKMSSTAKCTCASSCPAIVAVFNRPSLWIRHQPKIAEVAKKEVTDRKIAAVLETSAVAGAGNVPFVLPSSDPSRSIAFRCPQVFGYSMSARFECF